MYREERYSSVMSLAADMNDKTQLVLLRRHTVLFSDRSGNKPFILIFWRIFTVLLETVKSFVLYDPIYFFNAPTTDSACLPFLSNRFTAFIIVHVCNQKSFALMAFVQLDNS